MKKENEEKNLEAEKTKPKLIDNSKEYTNLSLFIPKIDEKEEKYVNAEEYIKYIRRYVNKAKTKISREYEIKEEGGIRSYYQFIDPGDISYDGYDKQKLPILGWYKVYEKKCGKQKIYGYLYL
jgi:hypothetical protein